MDALNTTQRSALSQLQAITDGCDADVAVSVLESVDWDVQKAADVLFGDQDTTPASRIESFEIDDSLVGRGGGGGGGSGNGDVGRPATRPSNFSVFHFMRPAVLFSIFLLPFHLVSSILRSVWLVLRVPFAPQRFSSLLFFRPFSTAYLKSSDPNSTADRWVRALEEETGATCISRVGLSNSDTDGISEDGRKLLPDFMLGGYEEALRKCEKEARVGCIVLVSDEHDDVGEFKRRTLTDSKLVHLMHTNGFVVWGGDVRDREAWSAAQKLQATTYPFVAFLALQPRRGSSALDSLALTVLSRHQGRCSSSGPTSPEVLFQHLEQQLLPRVNPFLERTRQVRTKQEHDRRLREEQDHAFQDSARRDRERLQARIESEKAAEEEQRRKTEELQRESVRKAKVEAIKFQQRRWARKTIKPHGAQEPGAIRTAVRLPDGGRTILHFPPTMTLTALYAYVDASLITLDSDPAETSASLEDNAIDEKAIEDQVVLAEGRGEDWWRFRLVTTYPRREIKWQPDVRLGEIDGLKGGCQIVVEMVEGFGQDRSRGVSSNTEDLGEDADGYDTEESDS